MITGVLILSEFVGAAQTLGSGALLVNPFNTDELSRALYDALHMPEQESRTPAPTPTTTPTPPTTCLKKSPILGGITPKNCVLVIFFSPIR